VGLLVRPAGALRLFWYGVVPLLPATFLLNAELWRNVCPVATLGAVGAGDAPVRPLDRRAAGLAAAIGILLFLILVPARHVLFNGNAPATFTLLAAAGSAALAAGWRLDRKAGFCNAVCPILPIERLYGQRPLLPVVNARCAPCRVCTRHACFDLNPERSALVSIGPAAGSRRWVTTPFGAFALALPGLVTGYYVASDTALSGAAGVYALTLAWGFATWVALSVVFTLTRTRPAHALVAAAGMAAASYYWFTPVAVGRVWDLDSTWVSGLRMAGLFLVGVWTLRALAARSTSTPASNPITASVET
jgi:hypothetical protein